MTRFTTRPHTLSLEKIILYCYLFGIVSSDGGVFTWLIILIVTEIYEVDETKMNNNNNMCQLAKPFYPSGEKFSDPNLCLLSFYITIFIFICSNVFVFLWNKKLEPFVECGWKSIGCFICFNAFTCFCKVDNTLHNTTLENEIVGVPISIIGS
tara:strand:+ start:1249 stop:1707 length:459 start_codon:yes stop_codon:yes gene_type:complete